MANWTVYYCAGFRLGSKKIFVFFNHNSWHLFSCTAIVMKKKIYCCSHGAKKQEPTKAIQLINQYLQPSETCKASPSPENIPFLFLLTINFVLALIEPDPNTVGDTKWKTKLFFKTQSLLIQFQSFTLHTCAHRAGSESRPEITEKNNIFFRFKL